MIAFAPGALAAGAAALLALASCSREQIVDADESFDDGVQHAYIVAPTGTRTDFDSYVGKFAWSEGDQIAIHLSDGAFYATGVNAETGAFTCSTTPSKQRDAYAVYPVSACDASNYGSPVLNVVLPAEYDISSNLSSDYSPVPMIAVNKQGEDDLYFRHVGSLVRITCDRVPVGTQKIAVTFDRNVAGTFTVVNPMSDHPTISNGGSTPTVTFQIASSGLSAITDEIVLNVPVPVGKINAITVAHLNAAGEELTALHRTPDFDAARGYGKKYFFGAPCYNMSPVSDVTLTYMDVLRTAVKKIAFRTERDEQEGYQGTGNPTHWRAYFVDGSASKPQPGTVVTGNSAFQTEPIGDWLTVTSPSSGDGTETELALRFSPDELVGMQMSPSNSATEMMTKLAANSVGTVDLSTRNFLDPANPFPTPETANCYIVDGYGTFLIPLVYGNAYKNGDNVMAYAPGVVSSYSPESVLATFIGPYGEPISSPFILTDQGLSVTDCDAVVVWQDVAKGFEIVKAEDVEVVSNPTGAAINGCDYIRFTIRQENIKSGNVLIALRDKTRKDEEDRPVILWSWHIWLRADIVSSNAEANRLRVQSVKTGRGPIERVEMLSECLGWTPPITFTGGHTIGRSQWLAIVSTETEEVIGSIKLTQNPYDIGTNGTAQYYSATFYQQSRKDPFLPGCGTSSMRNRASCSDEYKTVTTYRQLPQSYNIGSYLNNIQQVGYFIQYPYLYAQVPPTFWNFWDADYSEPWDGYAAKIKKTIYDPSPRGFTIPREESYTGFTASGLTTRVRDEKYCNSVSGSEAGNPDWTSGLMLTSEHSADPTTYTIFFPQCGDRYASAGEYQYSGVLYRHHGGFCQFVIYEGSDFYIDVPATHPHWAYPVRPNVEEE